MNLRGMSGNAPFQNLLSRILLSGISEHSGKLALEREFCYYPVCSFDFFPLAGGT